MSEMAGEKNTGLSMSFWVRGDEVVMFQCWICKKFWVPLDGLLVDEVHGAQCWPCWMNEGKPLCLTHKVP